MHLFICLYTLHSPAQKLCTYNLFKGNRLSRSYVHLLQNYFGRGRMEIVTMCVVPTNSRLNGNCATVGVVLHVTSGLTCKIMFCIYLMV